MDPTFPRQTEILYLDKWQNISPLYKNLVCFSALALTALLSLLPLVFQQSLFVSHDMNIHIFQSDQFYQSIISGSFFPKWAADSNNGYGSANFIFYSPLSYYLVSIIRLLNISLMGSMILAIWCSFFLSGIAMFITARTNAGFAASLVIALIYQIFPYHIFDLYFRGTFAELFAYIWFPLIILSLKKMHQTKTYPSAVVTLSISYAGLILTHLVSGYIFTLIICVYVMYRLFMRAERSEILSIFSALSLGLGLSSYFLIPVIFERKFVQIDYVVNYIFSDYRKNFLFLPDNLFGEPGFYLFLHISVFLELIFFVCVLLFMKKQRQSSHKKSKDSFFIFSFLLSFFMTIPASGFIWEITPGLKTVQFPWRWVMFMELSLVFLLINYFKMERKEGDFSGNLNIRVVAYLLVSLCLFSVISVFKCNKKIPENELNSVLFPEQAGYYPFLPKEYTPVWATDLEKLLAAPKSEKVSIVSGRSTTRIIAWQPETRVIDVEALTPVLLRMATFYYPGWTAEIDGRRTAISLEKNTGAMLVELPEGNHILSLKFVDTNLRSLAKYASLISVFLLSAYIVVVWKYNKTTTRKWRSLHS